MAYSSEIADVLTAQLDRLSTLNPHQLAGQVANLEFWLHEVTHCQNVIDGYRARFDRMKAAEANYVREHDTKVVYPDVALAPTTPVKPRRVPDDELQSSRLQMREAFYRFLVRTYREGLIDETLLRKTANVIDLSIDLVDLRR
jgi:hypothetical protein